MSRYSLKPLTDLVEIHDHLREPVNQAERNLRGGVYPYYGATGQVGWIDDYRQEGRYVLLGEDGAPFLDPYKPKAYIVEGKCWVNNHAHVLKGKDGLCDDEFLCLALNWADYSLAVTGSTRLKLPQSTMNRIFLPAPPFEVQRRIAARVKAQLAEVKTARHAAQGQAEDIALLRRGVLAEVFAAVEDAPRKVLGDHAPTTSGSTPPRDNERYWAPAEMPWVKTGEVAFAPITRTEESVSRVALAECSLTLLPPGTVLVAMYGQGKTRGQSAILEVSATTNQACFAIRPNDTWEPAFLFHWLMARYHELRELSEGRGGNQANLNGALLNALDIPAPDRAQQAAIARRAQAALREVEALASANQSQRAELDRLPQRLIAQAFDH
jgi:restriction endonuclease S subunit